jgi:SAM-dependent methyltransferase
MPIRKDLHEDNRIAWNAATDAHNSHKADQAAFFRADGSTLFPEELALLGDVNGQTLLHLQCNAGQDTLSLARLGAIVTGVDISDTAIAFARQLSADTGIPATFHRADVYDWLAEAERGSERYDIVFSSYGALVWLSDIEMWAQGISAVLKPGGRFVLVEFHPFWMVFDDEWRARFPYGTGGQAITFEHGIGDYVGISGAALTPSGFVEGIQNFENPHRGHEFNWSIAEVVTALLKANLTLTAFHEYPYSNGGKLVSRMRELPDGRFTTPEDVPTLPLMYGLSVRKGS